MRKTFIPLYILSSLFVLSCESPQTGKSYRIVGTIENSHEGDTVMLQEEQDQNLVLLEKTYVKDGQFVFSGRQDSTVERIVTFVQNGAKMGALFFLENGEIKMELAETSSITGTKNNDKYQAFLNQINGIYGQISSVRSNLTDSLYTDTIHSDVAQKVQDLDHKANELIIKTIQENIDNPIGFYLFRRYNYLLEPKLQYFLISKMPAAWRRSSVIEDIKTQLDLLPADSLMSSDFVE